MQVKAQHLQMGDVIGSGETVIAVVRGGILMPKGKVRVGLRKDEKERWTYWGKYTTINIVRK